MILACNLEIYRVRIDLRGVEESSNEILEDSPHNINLSNDLYQIRIWSTAKRQKVQISENPRKIFQNPDQILKYSIGHQICQNLSS